MNVVVTGATGLVGSPLVRDLAAAGHGVARLRHTEPLTAERFDGATAVVHLAGENIAAGRWTASKKQRILDSRVQGTADLSRCLAEMPSPPPVLVCASAIGYYGDRGEEELTEQSAAGQGFLAEVCQAWEAAADPARQAGIRVVHLRFGMILSPHGGALPKMLTPFRLGAGGIIGNGRQYWSWVALDDVVAVILSALENDQLSGAVNVVSPQPVTNREFTKTLGQVLHRPTILPMPAFAARLALGEMANELLLASARVVPATLTAAGYQFQYAHLADALRSLLGRPTS